MSDTFETGVAGGKTGGVPIVDGTNFVEWLDLVQTVLLTRGLWEYAVGDVTKPKTSDGGKEFDREDAKAAAYLKIAAGRGQWPHLIGLTSSKAVLDKLSTVHSVSQDERLPLLQTQFYGFKARASIDLSASKLTQLQLEIAAVNQSEMPSDTTKKTILINSLPDTYQSTALTLRAAGLSKMSFDDVVQRLKEVEASFEKDDLNTDRNLARTAGLHSTKKSRNGRQSGQHGDRACHFCGRSGHFVKNCWRRLKAEEEEDEDEDEDEGSNNRPGKQPGKQEKATVAW